VEIVNSAGQPALDPVFSRGTPLPTEKTVKYRASHALVPGNPDSSIAIKLWEGEYVSDPDANDWVGNVLLSHDGVKRSVPRDAEIEVTIQVNPSRLVTVEAFVPHLNQHFSGRLFVPQREEQDFAQMSRNVASETQMYRKRLEDIESTLSDPDDESTGREVEEVRRNLDALDANVSAAGDISERVDPDKARRIVEESKNVRGGLGRLERRVAGNGMRLDASQFVEVIESATKVVTQFGSALDKQQFTMLRREFDRTIAKGDEKAVQRVFAEISGLRWRILYRQDWFWREIFNSLQEPGVVFVDKAEANILIADGQAAVKSGDGDGLRQAVRGLWELQPKDSAETARERVARSGLRKY